MNARMLPVYRIETPTLPYESLYSGNNLYFNREIAGQWFDIELDGAISHATVAGRVDTTLYPAQMAIALLECDTADAYHASRHKIASEMNYFPGDYIIPRDNSVPILTTDISPILSEGYLKSDAARLALRKLAWFTLKESGLYNPLFRHRLASWFNIYP